MAPRKIIIDTDPGVDDVFALLLALSSSPEELELALVSITFGNIDIESCLRNVVSLFHVLDLERLWRIENGKPAGFGTLEASKPIVAIGADRPLEGVVHEYDYFHGKDGLGNVHTKAPHFTPTQTWRHLFTHPTEAPVSPPRIPSPASAAEADNTAAPGSTSPFVALPPNFRPSSRPAHLEILELLRANPPGTIDIIAVGPLTNLALAAAEDYTTFSRAARVLVMGGTINLSGNVTPVGEFNAWADAYASAQVYALTSPSPGVTMPCSEFRTKWADRKLSPEERLNLTIFPLDITTRHLLSWKDVEELVVPLADQGSPLAGWIKVFAESTFGHMAGLYTGDIDLALHDPVVVWYVLTGGKGWTVGEALDVRVEAEGKWTKGMCVVDRRDKRIAEEGEKELEHDRGQWLHKSVGNRVNVAWKGDEREAVFGRVLLGRIFGIEVSAGEGNRGERKGN